MTQEEFSQLIYPFMDGELDEATRLKVEAFLESSTDAQKRLALEQRLQERSREILCEPADMVVKGRLLANLRAAAAPGAPEVAKAAPITPIFLRRSWQVPAAAAVLFFVAWLGGAFDSHNGIRPADIPQDDAFAESPLIDVVRVSEKRFQEKIEHESERVGCRYECVKRSLVGLDDSSKFWPPASKESREARYSACAKLVSECMGRNVELPNLPKRFELVAARHAKLSFGGKIIQVPHLILMSKTEKLSVYVICDAQGEEIAKGLHEIVSRKNKSACLLGCPQRGVMVRRVKDVWMVLISKMGYQKLQTVAEEI